MWFYCDLEYFFLTILKNANHATLTLKTFNRIHKMRKMHFRKRFLKLLSLFEHEKYNSVSTIIC